MLKMIGMIVGVSGMITIKSLGVMNSQSVRRVTSVLQCGMRTGAGTGLFWRVWRMT